MKVRAIKDPAERVVDFEFKFRNAQEVQEYLHIEAVKYAALAEYLWQEAGHRAPELDKIQAQLELLELSYQ